MVKCLKKIFSTRILTISNNTRKMKEKKTPLRMCIACREMKDKRELIRIVRTPEGEITLDFTGKKNGRGAYVCADKACMEKCRKSKILSKAFKQNVDSDVYDKLVEELERGNG